MSKVVVLRPEPGASATLARAKAVGIDAVAIPLFEIAPMAWDTPEGSEFDMLLLTSANAVRHGGAGLTKLRHLPAYCVGEATAEAARDAGLTVAGVGLAGANALATLVPQNGRPLHLAGVAHRAISGVPAVAVYDSRAIDPPPPLAALQGGVAMVHSARAGARLAELVSARSSIMIAAISPAAAAACGAGWGGIEAVKSPEDGALLALAGALWQSRG